MDGQPADYPDEVLRAMKKEHLDWVDRNLENEMSDIKFPELEVVCSRLISSELADSTALHSLSPRDKINLNDLGLSSSKKITMRLMQAPLVAEYLQSMVTHVDPDFPPRLIAGFRHEYDRYRSTGIKGDGLFLLMESFAAGTSADQVVVFDVTEAAPVAVGGGVRLLLLAGDRLWRPDVFAIGGLLASSGSSRSSISVSTTQGSAPHDHRPPVVLPPKPVRAWSSPFRACPDAGADGPARGVMSRRHDAAGRCTRPGRG
ncbi:hypothetical protein [Streptomyces sp. NPDC052036]|uniref:hypothetical protein n=1 Tax=Streptomyces sp. NPDC052036 TaxID=3155171 RepID=UPI00341B7CFE